MIRRLLTSRIGRTAGIYTGASILNAAVPFFLLPVLTRYLSPRDYGIVAMFNVLFAFAMPFAGLNVHGAMSRRYFEHDSPDMKRFVTTALVILGAATVLVSAVLLAAAGPVASLAGVPAGWLWCVPVIATLRYVTMIVLVLWQIRMMAVRYGIYQILLTAANLCLSILLVVGFGMDWRGRILAETGALALFTAGGIAVMIREGWIGFRLSRDDARYALRFGVPLIPHTLGTIVITISDRVFITNMVGLGDTGIYSVGYQIGMVISLVQDSFNRAWVPWFYERLGSGGTAARRTIVRLTYAYFAGIIALAVVFSLAMPPFLGFFLGESFAGASRFVIWIALGYAFNGMYKMVGNYLFYVKRTGVVAAVTFMTALLNLALNYLFVERFGAIGAAQATTISFAVSFAVTWAVAARVYPMSWLRP